MARLRLIQAMMSTVIVSVAIPTIFSATLYAYKNRAKELGSFGVACVLVLILYLMGHLHGVY
jgi:hypothetical protein